MRVRQSFFVRCWRACALFAAFLLMVVTPPWAVSADELASSLYVRTDNDHTTVVSPHARIGKELAEGTKLDVTYAADIWTSASIDIRTSASVRPVTEQRDEVDVALAQDLTDFKLNAAYRFSTENDYTSHGLTLGGSYDFADNAATLDLSVHGIADTVGRSGDPRFSRSLTTLDTRLSLTQVIDTETIAQLTYELAQNHGYQSSPYRYVGIGGNGFGCRDAMLCLPEHVPDTRMRHAFALLLKRALSDDVSVGATYRFYFDQWALQSHTILTELGWNVAEQTLLTLRYRFYTQGAVRFYQARYLTMPGPSTYTTRDRELSPLAYHRLAFELERGVDFDGGQRRLAATLGVGGAFFSYGDFVGLQGSSALEVTTAVVLTL